ncbi:uncharacterized protein LOC134231541 [Saccostrea cucullata]|uniref:uncharacterized protein LOC134231541 n=1 Tax=Saccostrea cuccullata TaxID=36930 RepID=UPI002ED4BFBB
MTKKFSDPVSKDKDNQEGSIFSMWTYRDYLKFWITSIKTFGGKKAPVFVIVTHAENKSTNEIEKFFTELWDTVPAEETDWLSDSLNDREYAVGLLELNDNSKQMLNSIKESIVELFKNEINTKMELPSSWALMEQLLYDGDWKVLSLADIWRLNSSLPHEYKIKSNGEMSDFLKCFNDNGLILYCEEKNLREHAILDIQWFANAFSKIIADENHITKDCRRSLRREWKSFNKTGELKEKVVDALWKDEPSYLKHKSEIMSYMEKLQMLVPLESFGALSEGGMTWYVPCMNKKQFKADFCEEKWDRSSILCFRFTSFAIFEFYRLVAYCIGVLSWKVSTDGDNEGNLCLYQTAAVFDCKEHTVAIGICNDEIQLQVLRIKPLTVEKEVSSKIGHSIENAVEILTKTFTDTKKFQKGIKCQKNIFYENDTSFTLVSELSKIKTEKTQCACRLQEKHIITLQKTLGFWEKKREGSPRKSCTYPFSKRASQKDALTSHLKAEVIRSVGLIYVDGHPAGTGFRVGEKYIMTCLHIIERIVQGPLDFIRCERVYIQFERMVHLQNTDQSKIFLIEPTLVYKHQEFDVAVLELKKQGIQFPQPLTLFSANCLPSEEVHLIGHPGGVQMKEDSEVYLSVIEPNNDVDKYIKELSEWSMEKFMNNVDYYSRLRELPRKILFHTTFDQGSSGSPGILIRNHKPCVALIVAGGVPSFYYEDGVYVEPEKRVEFGYALRDVFDEMQTNEINKKLSSEIFKEWIS